MFSHAAASVAEQAPHMLDDKVSLCLWHFTCLAGISLE